LREGAAESIQAKLVDGGYLEKDATSGKLDGRTERALRNFQREQSLPATGVPDDLTLQKLGLSPQDLFRSSSPKPQQE
jgi:peptidoglycan hydrolase-like protein with peptidoglycan-binding domain